MPAYSLLIIGGFGLCLLALSFLLFLWNRMQASVVHDAGNVNPLLIANEVRNDIENIEWLTELLLKQEFGKLKIGQIELLDEIRRFSDHGLKQVGLLQRKEQTAKNVGKAMFPMHHPHRHHTEETKGSGEAKQEH